MSNDKQQPNWLFNRYNTSQGIIRQLTKGMSAQIFVGDNSMLSIARLEPHTQGELHSHPEEQWGFLLEGECVRIQEGKGIHVSMGDFWHTPSNVQHGIRSEEQAAVVLDFFSPPRPEYREVGKGFGIAK
ncbi:cupin [Candidatus Heimdallarchaeota archaeon B3_Heim]|nr:MAG: cupin [Candidatus Heimdallarchaeota archaeon B3_Heim]